MCLLPIQYQQSSMRQQPLRWKFLPQIQRMPQQMFRLHPPLRFQPQPQLRRRLGHQWRLPSMSQPQNQRQTR
jgi:hypothetical protein